MNLRSLDRADAEGLLRLWNAAARLDPLTPALLAEKIWGDPDFDADLALVAEDGGHQTGFAVAVVRPGAARGVVKLIAVAPARWRQGTGGRLLAALEERMAERGARAIRLGESAPNYLVPGLDPRYTRALLFFEKHGYERFGETYNLEVDLEADDWETAAWERSLAEAGIEVRRAEDRDREVVATLLREHWPAWQAELAQSMRQAPVALHLALRGTEVLGFSAYDGNNRGTGWFGPMGTAPAARGLGIGGVLLRRCLRDLRAQGLRRATIPWVGPVAFYAHHAGAEIARVFYRYEKGIGAGV
jgi:mycothiol synthase